MCGTPESLTGSEFRCGSRRIDESSRELCVACFAAICTGGASGDDGRPGSTGWRIGPAHYHARVVIDPERCGGTGFRRQLLALPYRADEPFAPDHRNRDHAHENAGAAVARRRTTSLEISCTVDCSPHLVGFFL